MDQNADTVPDIDPHARALACVSGDRLNVRCLGGSVNAGRISAIAVDRDGAEHRLMEDPATEAATVYLNNLTGRLSDKTRSRMARSKIKIDRSFVLDPSVLYRSIRVVFLDEASTKVPWATRDAELDFLLPNSVAEYRDHISFDRRRHKDPATVRFSARQVLADHENKLDHVDPEVLGYIVNSFVIYIYKSIELRSTGDLVVPSAMLQLVFGAISRMDPGKTGVRSDKDHLFISVNTCLWHFYIHNSEPLKAENCLEIILDTYRNSSRFVITHGYNYCLSILVCGLIRLARKVDAPGRNALETVVEIFRRSVAQDTRNVTWFAEMADSHRAALSAIRVLEIIKQRKELTGSLLAEAAKPGIRVKGDDFQRLVEKVIEYFVGLGPGDGSLVKSTDAPRVEAK
ncbi:hypothetical protein [Roseomonas sp. 18066]|uniref:hypothetical protein n=1 Tax=Roseomonas sp. 18066 TaxID=2681412 RepID=UPI001359424B|nr:hypothetical protein [Roseomonas sp. 18066]